MHISVGFVGLEAEDVGGTVHMLPVRLKICVADQTAGLAFAAESNAFSLRLV